MVWHLLYAVHCTALCCTAFCILHAVRCLYQGEDLSDALNPMKIFSTPDLALRQGQLTSIGFMQHITLGSMLHRHYAELLDRITAQDQIYVRSTNYARTIQVYILHIIAPIRKDVLYRIFIPPSPISLFSYYNAQANFSHIVTIVMALVLTLRLLMFSKSYHPLHS